MADFYLHRDVIEQTLCENKNKPQLECKGTCALKKELERENKKEIPRDLQETKPFITAEQFHLIPLLPVSKNNFGLALNDKRTYKSNKFIFRPPSC
ncbi:MAG: hypothetical protein ABIN48_00720 [Ginsengibacter sp.]